MDIHNFSTPRHKISFAKGWVCGRQIFERFSVSEELIFALQAKLKYFLSAVCDTGMTDQVIRAGYLR